MKLREFSEMLRKIVREEVQLAVRKELKTLTESAKPIQQKKQSQQPKPQRSHPLVTLDSPFGGNTDNPINSLLQETANSMNGFGDEAEQANPDFPLGSSGTDMFIKDYSSILERSQEIR